MNLIVVYFMMDLHRRSSRRLGKYSMHYIFLIVPYPERIVVICSRGISDLAIVFSSYIFYLSA